jgi:thioredoxin reductase (NADPH)
MNTCIAEQLIYGGLIVNVGRLWPGIEGSPPSGSEMAAVLMECVADLGVTTLFEQVTAIEPQNSDLMKVVTPSNAYLAKTVLVASGAELCKLNIPGEAEFEYRGVSHCADCDGPFYKGKVVVVAGAGDSALQEALILSDFCAVVHLIVRGMDFTARPDLVAAVKENQVIVVHFGSVVEALEGDGALRSVQLRDLATGRIWIQSCEGFFAFIGLRPSISYVPRCVDLVDGRIRVDANHESSLKNLFAAGAVRHGCGGLIADAVEDARAAVKSIHKKKRVPPNPESFSRRFTKGSIL